MKERFLLTLSWAAFAVALFVLTLIAAETLKVFTDVPVDNLHRNLVDFAYGVTGRNEELLLAFSPAVWLVLWIVTGSPRMLPWRW